MQMKLPWVRLCRDAKRYKILPPLANSRFLQGAFFAGKSSLVFPGNELTCMGTSVILIISICLFFIGFLSENAVYEQRLL